MPSKRVSKKNSTKRTASKSPSPKPAGKKTRKNKRDDGEEEPKEMAGSPSRALVVADEDQKQSPGVTTRRKSRAKTPAAKAKKTTAKKKISKKAENEKTKPKRGKGSKKKVTQSSDSSKKASDGNDSAKSKKRTNPDNDEEASPQNSLVKKVSEFLTPMKRPFRPWEGLVLSRKKHRVGPEGSALENGEAKENSKEEEVSKSKAIEQKEDDSRPESPLNLAAYRSPAALLGFSRPTPTSTSPVAPEEESERPDGDANEDTVAGPPQFQSTLTSAVRAVGKLVTPHRARQAQEEDSPDREESEEKEEEIGSKKEPSKATDDEKEEGDLGLATKATSLLKRVTASARSALDDKVSDSKKVDATSTRKAKAAPTSKKSKSKSPPKTTSPSKAKAKATPPASIVTPAPTRTSRRLVEKNASSPVATKSQKKASKKIQKKPPARKPTETVASEVPRSNNDRKAILFLVAFASLFFPAALLFQMNSTPTTAHSQSNTKGFSVMFSSVFRLNDTSSAQGRKRWFDPVSGLFNRTSEEKPKYSSKDVKKEAMVRSDKKEEEVSKPIFDWFPTDGTGLVDHAELSPVVSPVINAVRDVFTGEGPTSKNKKEDAAAPVLTAAWRLMPSSEEQEVETKPVFGRVFDSGTYESKVEESPPEPSVLMAAWNLMPSPAEEILEKKPVMKHVFDNTKETLKVDKLMEKKSPEVERPRQPSVTVPASKDKSKAPEKVQLLNSSPPTKATESKSSAMPGREVRQSLRRKMKEEKTVIAKEARFMINPSSIKKSIGKSLMRITPSTVNKEPKSSENSTQRRRLRPRWTGETKVASEQPFESKQPRISLASKTRNVVKRYTQFTTNTLSQAASEISMRKRALFKPRNATMHTVKSPRSSALFEKSNPKKATTVRPVKVPSAAKEKSPMPEKAKPRFELFRFGRDQIKAEMEAKEKFFEKVLSQISLATPLSRATKSVPAIKSKATTQLRGRNQATKSTFESSTDNDKPALKRRAQRILNFVIQENPLYTQFHAE